MILFAAQKEILPAYKDARHILMVVMTPPSGTDLTSPLSSILLLSLSHRRIFHDFLLVTS